MVADFAELGFSLIVQGLRRIVQNCAGMQRNRVVYVEKLCRNCANLGDGLGFLAIFLFASRFSLLNKTCRSSFRLLQRLLLLEGLCRRLFTIVHRPVEDAIALVQCIA